MNNKIENKFVLDLILKYELLFIKLSDIRYNNEKK